MKQIKTRVSWDMITGLYVHEVWPRSNLYKMVRRSLGYTQRKMSEYSGLTEAQVRYRERRKRHYHPAEIVFLKDISGLSWEDFGDLLDRCI